MVVTQMKTNLPGILLVITIVILLPLSYQCTGFLLSSEILSSVIITLICPYLLYLSVRNHQPHIYLRLNGIDLTVTGIFILAIIYQCLNYHFSPQTVALAIIYMAIRNLKRFPFNYGLIFLASGTIQSLIVIMQSCGLYDGISHIYNTCGTFYNPGQAGCFIAICLVATVGEILTQHNRLAIIISCIIQISGLILCDSRTAWLATIAGISYFVLKKKYIKITVTKILFITASAVVLLIVMFHYRPGSAIGRFLVWHITLDMFLDSPVYGHGVGSFSNMYMLYQASYFNQNPLSKFAQYADDVMMPFNEYAAIAVQYGIIGIIIIAILVYVILKSSNKSTLIWRGCFISFLIICFSSYPTEIFPTMALITTITAFSAGNDTSCLIPLRNNYNMRLISGVIIVSIFYIYSIKAHKYIKLSDKIYSLYSTGKDLCDNEYQLVKDNHFFNDLYMRWLLSDSRAVHIERVTDAKPSYDIYLALGIYHHKHQFDTIAIQYLQTASDMIPCRIKAKYHLWEIYISQEEYFKATEIATDILSQDIKVENNVTLAIKRKMKNFLLEHNEYQ